MKKHLLVFVAVWLTMFSASAQDNQSRQCNIELLKKHYGNVIPGLDEKINQTKQAVIANSAALSKSAYKTTAGTVTIPVVFHIILTQSQINGLGGTAGIIERIDSQLAVINRDFNKENPDASLIPAPFKSLHGNVNIRFALARRTPDGKASDGYEILTTTKNGFTEGSNVGSGMGFTEAKFLNGVTTAWNPDKYLNIWVLNPINDNGTAAGILGLAMPPSFLQYNIPGLTKNELGVVLNHGAFGKKSGPGYFISGINGGRTLTHELGHYFEIWHIWGDDNGLCPNNGGDDDGISDTPPQTSANYGCPSYPLIDNCTDTTDGAMFMNFMDYVNDACMQMFTIEQAGVMYSMVVPGSASYPLTQNPEVLQLPLTSVKEVTESNYKIYPNPTTGIVNIIPANNTTLNSVEIMDGMGRVIYNIAGGQEKLNIDLSGNSKGIYYIRLNSDNNSTVEKILVQ